MKNLTVKNLYILEISKENSVKNQTNIKLTAQTQPAVLIFHGIPNQDDNIEFALSATKHHEKNK